MGRPSVKRNTPSFDRFGDVNTVPYGSQDSYQNQPDPSPSYVPPQSDFPENAKRSLRPESFQSTLTTPYRDTDDGNSVRSLPDKPQPPLVYDADDVRRADSSHIQDLGIFSLRVFIFLLMVIYSFQNSLTLMTLTVQNL
jgi:hypothetical protein